MPAIPKKNAVKRDVGTSNQKFYCCRCGLAYSRQKGYFPVSHSPMYRGSGFLPICSECVDQMYDQYCATLRDERAAMRRMCMKLDLYWSDSIYDMVERTSGLNSRVRNYIGKSNLGRFINKTFDDTIKEEELLQRTMGVNPLSVAPPVEEEPEPDPEEEIIIEDDVRMFWGPGYTPSMYRDLEERRKYWMSKYPASYQPDIGEEALIRQICNLEIDINRDRAAGKSVDKNINTLNTIVGSLNLKPVQKKADDNDAEYESTPLGVWIRRWENNRPIPEPDPELKDVDGLIRYIDIWFRGHLAKMVGYDNAYSKAYEDEMARIKVERPEFEDEDDEITFNNVFASSDDE